MSRFKNSPVRVRSTEAASGSAVVEALALPGGRMMARPVSPSSLPARVPVRFGDDTAEATTIFQRIGLIMLIAFQTSAYLNEWSYHLVGTKAYLSTVLLLTLPVVWICCGKPFRALRANSGRWWLAFLVLLVVVLPFSAWRSDSVRQLANDIPRSFMLFFYVVSFAVSIAACRKIFYLNILTVVLILLNCAWFGVSDGSRFAVSDQSFSQNSNELALSLLMGTTSFAYLFFLKGTGKKVLAGGGMLLCLYFMLATGSRGSVVAAIAAICVVLMVIRNRLQVAIVVLAVFALPMLFAPEHALHRIALIFSSEEVPGSAQDVSAIDSRMQRLKLLEESLQITIQHPLTGIGIGQFPEYVAGEDQKHGKWSPWLGTHNSYTQVSSECGIPALLCYVMVIVWSFRLSLRLYRQTRYTPHTEVAGMALCCLAATAVYAVATFFFHMAYTGGLAYLGGQVLALHLAATPALDRARRQAKTAGTRNSPLVPATPLTQAT